MQFQLCPQTSCKGVSWISLPQGPPCSPGPRPQGGAPPPSASEDSQSPSSAETNRCAQPQRHLMVKTTNQSTQTPCVSIIDMSRVSSFSKLGTWDGEKPQNRTLLGEAPH